MGIFQLFQILGGAIGSIIGSVAADSKEFGISDWFGWRSTLLFPASAFLKLAFTWYCVDNSVLDTQAREKAQMRSVDQSVDRDG